MIYASRWDAKAPASASVQNKDSEPYIADPDAYVNQDSLYLFFVRHAIDSNVVRKAV